MVGSSYASADGDLNNFFNGLGFQAHGNSPSVYKSQAAGYATFGSIYARNRVRNIQIMHIDVPGFRSGCGGIDLFAGGFSFITADQLVQFMQSILSSGAGYALNLALEVELPEIAHAMQYMQELAAKINSGNFNSCEMAEDLVGGAWPQSRASQQQICQDIGSNDGSFGDWAASMQGCSTGGQTDSKLNEAKNDPAYKQRVYKDTNIIWDNAIKKNSFLSSDTSLGELYMTISGTIVFDENGAPTPYPSRISSSDFVKAMLYGGKVPTYTCKDSSDTCLEVDYSPSSYQTISESDALISQVKAQLDDIYTRVQNDEALTDEEIGMISLTQSSVFSVISANAQEHLGMQGIDSFAQMIATDILAAYLSEVLDIIESSLSSTQLDQSAIQNLFSSLQKTKEYVLQFDQQNRAAFEQALSINRSIESMSQDAMSGLSPLFKNAISQQQ